MTHSVTYRRRRSLGLCGRCEAPSPDKAHCDPCAPQPSTYRRRRSLGLCVKCEAPSGGKVHCEPCAQALNQKQKQKRNARRTNGLCVGCGVVESKDYLCDRCKEKTRKREGKRFLVTLGVREKSPPKYLLPSMTRTVEPVKVVRWCECGRGVKLRANSGCAECEGINS